MKRWFKRILWLLPAGAAVTVLSSWACTHWHDCSLVTTWHISPVTAADVPDSARAFIQDPGYLGTFGSDRPTGLTKSITQTLLTDQVTWTCWHDSSDSYSRTQVHHRAGFPFRSMEHVTQFWTSISAEPSFCAWRLPGYRGGWPIAPSINEQVAVFNIPMEPHIYPLAILPWGFAANALIYTALLAALIALFTTIRAHLRHRRGLCATCAYPHGPTPTCPECGTARKLPTTPAIPP